MLYYAIIRTEYYNKDLFMQFFNDIRKYKDKFFNFVKMLIKQLNNKLLCILKSLKNNNYNKYK